MTDAQQKKMLKAIRQIADDLADENDKQVGGVCDVLTSKLDDLSTPLENIETSTNNITDVCSKLDKISKKLDTVIGLLEQLQD